MTNWKLIYITKGHVRVNRGHASKRVALETARSMGISKRLHHLKVVKDESVTSKK